MGAASLRRFLEERQNLFPSPSPRCVEAGELLDTRFGLAYSTLQLGLIGLPRGRASADKKYKSTMANALTGPHRPLSAMQTTGFIVSSMSMVYFLVGGRGASTGVVWPRSPIRSGAPTSQSEQGKERWPKATCSLGRGVFVTWRYSNREPHCTARRQCPKP